MSKNDMNGTGTTTTAMALASNNFTGRILQPADFTALDKLIQTLGDKSANLTESEKNGAVAVIEEWDISVTNRIRANADMASMVLSFLNGGQLYGQGLEDVIELFHEALGDCPAYDDYRKAVEGYADVMRDKPIDLPVDGGMTVAQADKVRMDNYAAGLEHGRKVKVAEHAFNRAVKNYVAHLNGLDEVKALKGSLASYKNKAARMIADCEDKATRAKLNVTVSDSEVRTALHEMMDFAKSV